jgi:hypothetical protein
VRTPFLGAHAVARSLNAADQQCINLFPEMIETKSGKDVGALYMTPGLDSLVTVGTGPIRGMHALSTGGHLYVVSGNKVSSLDTDFTATQLGTITTGTGAVSIIDNGTQVALFDGSAGYLITVASGALAALALPFSSPQIATYQDGYGFVSQGGSQNVYQSAFNDLSSWPSLNFGQAAGRADNIVALAGIHCEVWFLKSTNFEVWVNAGTSPFVLARLDGVFPEFGCAAPASVSKAGEALIWLSKNEQGQGIVVLSQGYQPRRVSTHALEFALATYSQIADAVAYVYQQEGHVFYVINFPSGDATWALDITAMMQFGVPMWHRRALWVGSQFRRHPGNAFAFFAGKCVIGDYGSGNLYAYNMDTLTDAGTQRKWLRTWRALPKPTDKPVTFNSLRIDMETGIAVAAGTDPQVMLRFSDDGGHVWSNEIKMSVGKTGETAKRVKFNRLGSTRRNSGLDRIFELSSSDPYKVALIGAEIEAR